MEHELQPRQLYATILDAVADAVTAQDPTGALVYANLASAKLLGFSSPEALLQTTLDTVMRKIELWDIHGRPFPVALLPGRLALAGQSPQPTTLRMRHIETGDEFWLVASAKLVYGANGEIDYVVNTFRDVTESRRAQINQQMSEGRLQMLLGQMPAVLWSIDRDMRFTTGVGAGLGALGLRAGDLTGVSMQDYFGTHDPNNPAISAATRALQGETVKYELDWMGMIFQAHVEPLRSEDGESIIGAIGVSLDVTEQRFAEHALRQSEGQFRRLAESSTVGLIVANDQHKLIYANPAFCTMLGYSEDELINGSLRWDHLTPPEYADLDAQAVHELMTTGRCAPYEKVYLAKDGRHVPILVGATILFSMFNERFTVAAFVTDLTSTKAAETERTRLLQEQQQERQRVQQRAELLQQMSGELAKALTLTEVAQIIIDNSAKALKACFTTVGLVSVDGDTYEMLASNAPLPLQEHFRRLPLVSPSAVTDAIRSQQPMWITRHEEYEARYPELGGLVTRVAGSKSAAALPLIVEDRVIGGLSISFDFYQSFHPEDRDFLQILAHQCALALERARLYDAERKARQAAQRANDLKIQFLGMISHELRTPLTSIKGFASTLLADDIEFSPAQQRKFISILNDEADKLTDIVDQLLDLTSWHAGTLRIHPEPRALDTILASAGSQLATFTAQHRFQVQLAPALPQIMVDSNRIAQVISNLVNNAAKFSPPGTSIVLSAMAIGEAVQVQVADQGIGIAEPDRLVVFEAFRQLKSDVSQRKGAGLGLAICKALVEAHGGRIWIEDTRWPGTTIAFTLPIAPN